MKYQINNPDIYDRIVIEYNNIKYQALTQKLPISDLAIFMNPLIGNELEIDVCLDVEVNVALPVIFDPNVEMKDGQTYIYVGRMRDYKINV